jgi:hypothetical protein
MSAGCVSIHGTTTRLSPTLTVFEDMSAFLANPHLQEIATALGWRGVDLTDDLHEIALRNGIQFATGRECKDSVAESQNASYSGKVSAASVRDRVTSFACEYVMNLSPDTVQPMIERLKHNLRGKLVTATLNGDSAYIAVAIAVLETHDAHCGGVLTECEGNSFSVIEHIMHPENRDCMPLAMLSCLTPDTISMLDQEHWHELVEVAICTDNVRWLAKLYKGRTLSVAAPEPQEWKWAMLFSYTVKNEKMFAAMLAQAFGDCAIVGNVPVIHDAEKLVNLVRLLAIRCSHLRYYALSTNAHRSKLLWWIYDLLCCASCDTGDVARNVVISLRTGTRRRTPRFDRTYEPVLRVLLYFMYRPGYCKRCRDTRYVAYQTSWLVCQHCAIKGSTTSAEGRAKIDYWESRRSPGTCLSKLLPQMPDRIIELVGLYYDKTLIEFVLYEGKNHKRSNYATPTA